MKRLQNVPFTVRGMLPAALALGLAFLAVAVLAGRALAQDTGPAEFELRGVVTGEQGEPLVGAWVALEGDRWGSLTDEKGRFRLPDMAPGRADLVVQQLGYDTLRWSGEVRDGEPLALQMTAKPILLEGLHVVTDRFETRRRATPVTVRAYDRGVLATTAQQTMLDFIVARAGVPRVRCGGYAWSDTCFLVRGRAVDPVVWVDEAPLIGGMDFLAAMSPYDMYMVEVYGNGRQIRLYTTQFMERAAKTRLRPFPFIL